MGLTDERDAARAVVRKQVGEIAAMEERILALETELTQERFRTDDAIRRGKAYKDLLEQERRIYATAILNLVPEGEL